jgi:competence protein ComFC
MGAAQRSRLSRFFESMSGALLDIAVPRRCGLCGRFDTFLCARCATTLPAALPPRCTICWDVLGVRGACRSCAAVLVQSLTGLRSPYLLDGGARRLVHALKYDGLSALAEPMGCLMSGCLDAWGILPDVVVPVPLHPSRERRRGFNQASLLARSLAERSGLHLDPKLLRRIRATPPQVRTGGAEERQRNVAGAFAGFGSAAGRTVLLVDDVCTTGATVRACAGALRASGVSRVYALTFAREGQAGDGATAAP